MKAGLAILVLGLTLSIPKSVPKDAPIEMTAKGGLRIDLKNNIGRAKTDVVITRGDVTVCCDEAEAVYSDDRIEKVTCKGRVVIVRPDRTRATADHAVFVAAEDNVTLTGRARVVTSEAQLTGKRIIYDIKRDRLEVEGTGSRFIFNPKKPPRRTPTRACPPEP